MPYVRATTVQAALRSLGPGRASAWGLGLLLAMAPQAGMGAQTENQPPDVALANVRYSGGNWNPRPHGLPRLAWEIRKRTSIAIDLEAAAADPATQAIFNYPMLVWQGDAGFAPLPRQPSTICGRTCTRGAASWSTCPMVR